MFIKVPMKIFDYRLSGNEMKVYLYLARIKNDSEIAMAKRETIRMRCGLRSNTTVGSILHVLEQKGLISKFHRYAANGYYISSMYLLKPLVGKWFAFYADDMLPAVGRKRIPGIFVSFYASARKRESMAVPAQNGKGHRAGPRHGVQSNSQSGKKLLYC